MITDTLAPVVTQDGFGTISTLNGRDMLSKNFKFLKTEIDIYENKENSIYGLYYVNEKEDLYKDATRRLFVTEDAFFYTIDGWKSIEELNINEYKLIWGCKNKCIFCGDKYFSNNNFWSTCSNSCSSLVSKKNKFRGKTINYSNIEKSLEEGWMNIKKITYHKNISDIEILTLKSIDGGDGIFINNVLISNKNIVKPGYNNL